MKPEERRVKAWLESSSFQQVVYEPVRSKTPDFLVDRQIAVEVRRLNQKWFNGRRNEGLEEAEARLYQGLVKELKDFGPPRAGHSYYVSYRFGRPIERWSVLKPRVSELLRAAAGSDHPEVRRYRIGRALELDFQPAGVVHEWHFVLATYIDRQAGGSTNAVLIDSVKKIVLEKTSKVLARLHLFSVWWLVLVDRTKFGFDRESGVVLESAGISLEVFERLVVLDHSGLQVIADLRA